MAPKRYSDEDALKILREIDVHLHDGLDVVSSSLLHLPQPHFAKKIEEHAQPPALGGWLGFGRSPGLLRSSVRVEISHTASPQVG